MLFLADGKYVFVTCHLSEYSIKFDCEPVKADSKPDDTKTEVLKLDNSNNNNTTNNTNNTNTNNNTNSSNNNIPVPSTGDSNTITLLAIFGYLISAAAIFFTRRKKSV